MEILRGGSGETRISEATICLNEDLDTHNSNTKPDEQTDNQIANSKLKLRVSVVPEYSSSDSDDSGSKNSNLKGKEKTANPKHVKKRLQTQNITTNMELCILNQKIK
ncbi:UNVERIFIED_CONTAM: hypothetical protein RMT77_012533 [Armadillidium vulgare]